MKHYITEKRLGPLHHEYDEPPENYATSIDEVTNGGAPSSPPSLVRTVSEEAPSLTPSLSASLSDDRSDIGSAPSSSPLVCISGLGCFVIIIKYLKRGKFSLFNPTFFED